MGREEVRRAVAVAAAREWGPLDGGGGSMSGGGLLLDWIQREGGVSVPGKEKGEGTYMGGSRGRWLELAFFGVDDVMWIAGRIAGG